MNGPKSEPVLLARKQAVAYLRAKGCAISSSQLEKMAANENEGRGPPFLIYQNINRRNYRYDQRDLDAWAAKKIRRVE